MSTRYITCHSNRVTRDVPAFLAGIFCENDEKRLRVRTKHQSNDSQYNFIPGYEIEVEEQ